MECYKILSSVHDVVVALINSLYLQLPSQDKFQINLTNSVKFPTITTLIGFSVLQKQKKIRQQGGSRICWGWLA